MLLRDVLNKELIRRHGYGMLHTKLKPVHLANALMREEHERVGDMHDLKLLMEATAAGSSDEKRAAAVARLIERDPERWKNFDEAKGQGPAVLGQKVLPRLRALLGTDAAAFGSSPHQSSFSSPTGLTATGDPSDEHAGEFVFRLWSLDLEGTGRSPILDLWHRLTDPKRQLSQADDLTALLAPLSAGDPRPYHRKVHGEESIGTKPPSHRERQLWIASRLLARYEEALRPSAAASLQRVALLASLTVYFHALSRASEEAGRQPGPILIDASPSGSSAVARASTETIHAAHRAADGYSQAVLGALLSQAAPTAWPSRPGEALLRLMEQRGERGYAEKKEARELLDALASSSGEEEALSVLARELEAQAGNRTLGSFLRLVGLRAGLLYPQQKNLRKRCQPLDRTLEVLVAGAIDLGERVEYQDFAEALYERWGLVVGARPADAALLAAAGTPVPGRELRENSARFLARLEALGLARRLADTVAIVGAQEARHA